MEASQLTTYHYLVYVLKANVDVLWDDAHGCHRDCNLSATESGLMITMLLLLVCFNIPHGPWASDLRWQQVLDVIAVIFESHFRGLQPWFQNNLHQFLRESGCMHELACDSDVVEEQWMAFHSGHPFRKKGYNTNMNRFLSLVKEGHKFMGQLSSRRACMEAVCVELDWVPGLALEKLRVKAAAGPAPGAQSTSGRVMDCVDTGARKLCQNMVV